ncbi:SHOCT domain-containing protein [Gordonia sp. GONU]|uniref:SHOCT domain-containing protein n=1 Tax=Gordonia TaxID=2053 RepID=UPI001EE66F9B|nr:MULTISPECIES: SHOCT domain-containing protein [Gordonia]MCR8899017.1 SHOCT domain-containing protein [Gordonia sp. GONU]MCZ4652989.1 SHOCT domain-containing protein [Gordonia amicalis]
MAGGGWVMLPVVMVIFWAVVIFGIAALFRTGRHREDSGADRSDDPLQILEDRLAFGEIDAEEYRARRQVLRHRHSDGGPDEQ